MRTGTLSHVTTASRKSAGRVGETLVRGFSLIEMLVTVLIILVLATLYWSPNSRDRQKQLHADCQKNLQKAYVSLEIYANDNGGKFPVAPGARTSSDALDLLVPKYTSDTSVFTCPGTQDGGLGIGQSILGRRISYAYYMGRAPGDGQLALMSDRQVNTRAKAVGDQVFSSTGKPPGNNHRKYGGNFLFCDGHTDTVDIRAPVALALPEGVTLLNP